MLNLPTAIAASGNPGAPIQYEWSVLVSRAMVYPLPDEHVRLTEAVWACNVRAGFAAALAIAEWTVWRYRGIIDLGDATARLEAGYLALVEPLRVQIPQPDEPFPQTLQNAHGPLKLARKLISKAFDYFRDGDSIVHAPAVSLALLARHVCPDRDAFEAWLGETLSRCNQAFPPSEDPLEAQPPVSRAFFFPDDASSATPDSSNPYVAA
jgi:hypothetical protein